MTNQIQLVQRIDNILSKVTGIQIELNDIRTTLIQEQQVKKKPTPPPVKVIEQPEKIVPMEKKKAEIQKSIAPVPKAIPESKKVNTPPPKVAKKKRDWEKFIGENLINKIGIAVLVLGIAFFVKYAIDKNWIGEPMRVMIGLLSGGLLIGIAHKLRKTYRAFSSVLVGGGLSIFYFTISIAFHEYQLFSQSVAFVSMIAITGFSIVLSLYYDRKELAILALLGGFLTPFMVSTGSGNYIVLFTYISILNAGMLILSYFKKWKAIHIISYVATILLYGSWLLTKVVGVVHPPLTGALVFGSVFYVMFFYMNVINNIRTQKKFNAFEIGILLSNTALFYAAGMFILQQWSDGAWQGLFTVLMAAVNFVFAYPLYRLKTVDRTLVFLLIGLVLSFVSLAAPVQLEGNYITLFWAVEAVLLLWLSQRSGIKLMKISSLIIMALMMISLVMDWVQIYIDQWDTIPMSILINKGFITSIVAAASVITCKRLVNNESEDFVPGIMNKMEYVNILNVLTILVLYLGGLLELKYQLQHLVGLQAIRSTAIMTYHLLLLSVLLAWSRLKSQKLIGSMGLFFGGVLFVSGIAVNATAYTELRNGILDGSLSVFPFLFHYINIALTLVVGYYATGFMRKTVGLRSDTGTIFTWVIAVAGVYLASTELDHLVVLTAFRPGSSITELLSQNIKVGYPILWGVCAFVMMMIGMRKQFKTLRIISLSLMFVTLVKLFMYDIRGISEGGKIAAFVSLGVLLLTVSFLYQKLKILVLGEGEQAKEEETTPSV